MGVTIHYRGSLNDKKNIDQFIIEMSDICDSMNWKYDVLDEDWSVPSKLSIQHGEDGVCLKGHAGLKGISFTPHQDCEPVRLTFDARGRLNSLMNLAFGSQKDAKESPWVFSKTQFAGPEVHISIIKLLKYINKKYIANLEVCDEGNYWETGDETTVNNRMNIINSAMTALEEGLRELDQMDNLTEDGLMKKIEDVIDKLSNDEGIQVKVMRIDSVLKKFEESLDDLEKIGINSKLLNFFKNNPDPIDDFTDDISDDYLGNLTTDELADIIAFENADLDEDDYDDYDYYDEFDQEEDDFYLDNDAEYDEEFEDEFGEEDDLDDFDAWEDDFLDGFEEEGPDLPNPSLN